MKRPLLIASAIPALLLGTSAKARDDEQLWATAAVTVKASDQVRIQNELIARFSDNRSGLYEIENNLLLGYKLSDRVTAWAGYVHNPQYNDGDFVVMERRAREQLTIDNFATLGRVQMSARLRTEQRWRDHVGGTGWRVRPYVKVAMPLGGTTAPVLQLTNETFFNLNTTTFQTVDGLDRARTALSLQLPLSSALKGEIGYLNQHRFVRHGPDDDDHALTVSLALAL